MQKRESEVVPAQPARCLLIGKALLELESFREFGDVGAMRRVQEGASSSCRDFLLAVFPFVPAIVMQVARDEDADLSPEDLIFEESEVTLVVHIFVIASVHAFVNPERLRVAQDDPVGLSYIAGHFFKVRHLWAIDVRSELDIGAQKPPTEREFQGEITALLLRPPSRKPPPGSEQAREGNETVIPIMVA